ncbi:hypothetical protein QTP70_009900 [Hemibagrus guttatus]|uniref:ribonuclease H n=1 Tax=Hemibagrus guttatus TaxID=175788 RepID=A0AAE0PQZ9_9TELE|nr:hypothetical protein QTP70_009900 [Hemibagrus guttatus]
MERRKVDILCVQETRWKGSKARSIGAGFKLFYYGVDSKRNGVGVVLKEEFVRNVLEVGCELEEKERFWSELDEVMESIPTGDEEVMGKFGVKERNLEGQMVVDFAKRMDMGVVNTYFQKREEHRVTYKSGGRRTQIEKKTKWWKLKKEECSEVIRETGRKVLGVSSGRRKEDKETWWWNEEVQDSIQRKRLAKKKWDMDRTEENRQEYKELQRRVKREVSKAKQKAYEELYTRLDTREGEKDLYRLARQRDRDGKDMQQVRVIKDRDGRVLTSEESVQRRWKEYFEELMNEENEREKRVKGVNSVEQKVDKIRKDEVRKALKRMKSGKAVGPDDIPVEVWKCLGEAAVEFLANLFNRVLENLEKAYDRVPREELWYCMRKSGVAEKYVRVVQDMYERSRTVVRCAVGQTEEFNVEVGLHQGSALSPFLFAMVMDQLSEEVRQESPWTMMFADDIVICSESREQVEENLERWRFALERRGMKVSRSKTEYMCVNEREGSGTVRLQGEEVKKVQEFKYLGSTVQSNGECGKEVKKRVQAGWNGWRKVSGVLCDQKISVRIKGKVYRTVVRPAMLYGLETVSLRKRQESELEVAELKMLRFSLGVTRLDRIRNEYIRGTAHVGRLGDKVREARLRWFGHVQRRDILSQPREQQWTEQAALRISSVQCGGAGDAVPDPDWLRSPSKEVQDPVAEGGVGPRRLSFSIRCVRARWRVVLMASSMERFGCCANCMGSSDGGSRFLMCLMTSLSKNFITMGNTLPPMNPSEVSNLQAAFAYQSGILREYRDQLTKAQVANEYLTQHLQSLPLPVPRKVSFALPDKFNGSAEQCKGFLRQVEIFFMHQGTDFESEETKCAFLMSLLTGKAIEWAVAVWETDRLFQTSYTYFVKQLRDVFEYPAGGKDVSTHLLQLSQGCSLAAEYAIEFRTLAAQSGWNDVALKAMFQHSLNIELQAELACKGVDHSFAEYVTLAIQIDNLMLESSQRL